jgi:SAM-dependent methyltransferase
VGLGAHSRESDVTATYDERGPIPSDRLVQLYSGSPHAEQYIVLGDNLLAFLVQHGRLQPNHHVLDVGCGIGLAARPLTRFLNAEGTYDGFDIMLEPIEWCRTQYKDFRNFRFQRADVYSSHYNPDGASRAKTYRFPYTSAQFDLVVLTSVFTHLVPDDLQHYLGEVARVMKPGGRCFITYFLLNPESRDRVDAWLRSHPDPADRGTPGGLGFRWTLGDHCRVFDRETPETAVAYDEAWLKSLYASEALGIESVQYGQWCRGSFQPGWQDSILAVKGQ